MAMAARLALRGHGGAEPNPLVGCVIVSPRGEVVGWGYHRRCGGPHAEIVALRRAASKAAAATVYDTLYTRIVAELSGTPLINEHTGVMAFLPNPDAAFGGQESWRDFCEEVDNGKQWTRDMLRTVRKSRCGIEEGVDESDHDN